MTLEDMNLDRKADFEGDAFDPFNIGRVGQGVNLQLQAQKAMLDVANSKGGNMWTPEQLAKRKEQLSAAAANGDYEAAQQMM